jgi:atypical dual specificity phosphatase
VSDASRLPGNFTYINANCLAGSSTPVWTGDVAGALAAMRAEGIRAIVSLDEDGLSAPLVHEYGMDHLHCPIEDFAAPTLEQMDRCVAFIERHVERNEPVAVHCRAGIGRTGTVLSCYLVKHENLSAAKAIAEVRRRRPGSIETSAQETLIHAYARRLKKGQ